jgi:hypothetical protein
MSIETNQLGRRAFLNVMSCIGLSSVAIDPSVKITAAGEWNIFADWWCDLNGWQWPSAWGDPPERFRFKMGLTPRERYEHCKEEFHRIMDVLEKLAGGEKEVLRHANVVREKRMTTEAFEKWWTKMERREAAGLDFE